MAISPSTPSNMGPSQADMLQKRGRSHEEGDQYNDATRRAFVAPKQLTANHHRVRASSPVKNVPDLRHLEKPIHVRDLGATHLRDDIKSLYLNLESIGTLREAFSLEVQNLLHSSEEPIQLPCFRGPESHNAQEARSIFDTMCNIVDAALVSQRRQRHGAAWNNLVHTPLLEVAFGSYPPSMRSHRCGMTQDSNHQQQEQNLKPVSVRFEPAMMVTIALPWIPRLSPDVFLDKMDLESINPYPNDIAFSASVGDVLRSYTLSEPYGAAHISEVRDNLHARSDSKKVDYVVVLDMQEDTPLQKIISALVTNATLQSQRLGYDTLPIHVNQTTYGPVAENPIAVSIYTMSDSDTDDPLTQLGIWVAAWHKRMKTLWSARQFEILDMGFHNIGTRSQHANQQTAPMSSLAEEQVLSDPLLVSLPLIVTQEHQWQIYFACDRGHSIDLYGPLNIGSTATILDAYTLLGSLQAVRRWIETDFYAAMKAWFACNE
ncbi:putative PD-(D/E)XK nuclease-like domain-containing protein [Seiridium cardinale]|uniref:PD-(D/E)XK nuclease-like domain-containing protein n=1 Tax=Seiridium cardinale TaxID=138064 RepID=A0ABR2Y1E5_9PEZI